MQLKLFYHLLFHLNQINPTYNLNFSKALNTFLKKFQLALKIKNKMMRKKLGVKFRKSRKYLLFVKDYKGKMNQWRLNKTMQAKKFTKIKKLKTMRSPNKQN